MYRFELRIVSVLFCVGGLVSGCTMASSQEIPEGWRLIEVDRAFSFSAPESVRAQDAQVVDSLAATLSDERIVGQEVLIRGPELEALLRDLVARDERIEILYDYGWYSSPLTEYDDQLVSSSNDTLDGRPARFIETENLVAVHVPTVVDQTGFTMVVRFANPEHRDLGRADIASVRFESQQIGPQ